MPTLPEDSLNGMSRLPEVRPRLLEVTRVGVTKLRGINMLEQTFIAQIFVQLRFPCGADDSDLCVGGSVFPLDANGKPVLGADGKPIRLTDPRVPPGGSIGPGGQILDKDGKPALGADGKPMIVSSPSQIPPGGSKGHRSAASNSSSPPALARIPSPSSLSTASTIAAAAYSPTLAALA